MAVKPPKASNPPEMQLRANNDNLVQARWVSTDGHEYCICRVEALDQETERIQELETRLAEALGEILLRGERLGCLEADKVWFEKLMALHVRRLEIAPDDEEAESDDGRNDADQDR
jgi:hypothetical protein